MAQGRAHSGFGADLNQGSDQQMFSFHFVLYCEIGCSSTLSLISQRLLIDFDETNQREAADP